jgi:hypothetical protein
VSTQPPSFEDQVLHQLADIAATQARLAQHLVGVPARLAELEAALEQSEGGVDESLLRHGRLLNAILADLADIKATLTALQGSVASRGKKDE